MSNFRFYAKGGKTTILKTGGKLVEKDIEILGDPSGSLDEYFSGSLKRIVIKAQSADVPESFFAVCEGLEYVDFASEKAPTAFRTECFIDCYNLDTIVIRGSDVIPSIGDATFSATPFDVGVGYLYVPRTMYQSYEEDRGEGWINYRPANMTIRILEDYTVDGTIWGELDPAKI